VLCHDVRDGAGKIVGAKGARLDAAGATAVLTAPWDEIHVLEIHPGDLHEEEAGARLARAAIGPGADVKGYTGGQWTLVATRRGLLSVARTALADVNAVPPLGLEGVEATDDGTLRHGIPAFGALGIGGLKMKAHKAAIAQLFERNDLVLDAEQIYDLAAAL